MSVTSRCPECGTELTTGATDGLCPRCLLQAAMDSHDAVPPFDSPYAATTPQSGAFTPPEPAELMPHFPQLEILELLGHGGMGAVYKARQKKLDRLVALKIIRPESADNPAFAERFNREARTLARLSHPNIVAVHDFGEVGPASRAGLLGPSADRSSGEDSPARQTGPTLYYFVMEYVDGPNLRQMLEAAELQPAAALAIVPQVCEALQYAHDAGVVHRDIKPENILLDRKGRVKIADFGLAKLSQASPQDFTLTATHQVMGTPRYMAPEQMAGSRTVDHRADIYSLGVVFYEMLTGELPMGHFAPPSQKSPAVDARLDEVVLRALASEPERRYQQASELETDVEAIAGSGRDSESRATVAAGVSRDSQPGMSSILEQNVAAAAGWFGGRTAPHADSGTVRPVHSAEVTRRVRGPGIALMLYGLLLLLPAAFLILNGYDIADGNDATPAGIGLGLIFAGLAVAGVTGLLLRGGWHMLTLEKLQPALLASFVGQPIGLWGLLVLGRPEIRSAFKNITAEPSRDRRGAQAMPETRAIRQMLRGLGWLMVCVNLFALALGFVIAHANDVSLFASFSHHSQLEYSAKTFVWRGLMPFLLSPYVLIPLATLLLSVSLYVFLAGYLKARYAELIVPDDSNEVRRDLTGPSTGLIVTGLVNWIGIPVAVFAMSGWVNVPLPSEPVIAVLAVLAFVAGGVMIAAGILMRRLRGWPFALVGSVLAMVVSPGSLIGLPIGIWSLVVLSQPEIREAFRRRRWESDRVGRSTGGTTATPTGGDWVALARDDIDNDRLPDVCMVCGEPTTERLSRTFEHTPDWAAVLIFIGILAGVFPGIIVAVLTSRQVRIACPVCPPHRRHWSRLVWWASTGWLLPLSLAGIGFLIGNAWGAGEVPARVGGTTVGAAIGLVAWLVPVVYLASTRVSVEAITADEVRFQRVAPAFARAIRDDRRGAAPISAGTRPTGT